MFMDDTYMVETMCMDDTCIDEMLICMDETLICMSKT
jgi:hypothetical protein